MKKLVAQATGGQVEVQVYHGGTLGKIRENLEMAKAGTVDFVLCGAGNVTSIAPELGIVVLPYLWKSDAAMFQALDGPFGDYLNARMIERGYYMVGWWDNGFRHVSNNTRPIMKPEDLKGLKIRSLPTKVHVNFFKALGASPTPMDFTELFQALQQGVVDGQENPPGMVYFSKFQEVQKYYSLTGHVNEPGCLLASKLAFDKLPKDLALAVKVAIQKATIWQRDASAKDNAEMVKKLAEAGMKINEVPPETIEAFRKLARQLYPESDKDFGAKGQELIDLMVFFND